jgi:hypothetical protein
VYSALMTLRPLALLVALALAAASCGPTRSLVQAIDSAVDCHGICKRYQSCFSSSYDVGACERRCTDLAGNDPDARRKVERCAECITDKACTSATFSCALSCGAVLP